jgi:hypothetical protein
MPNWKIVSLGGAGAGVAPNEADLTLDGMMDVSTGTVAETVAATLGIAFRLGGRPRRCRAGEGLSGLGEGGLGGGLTVPNRYGSRFNVGSFVCGCVSVVWFERLVLSDD